MFSEVKLFSQAKMYLNLILKFLIDICNKTIRRPLKPCLSAQVEKNGNARKKSINYFSNLDNFWPAQKCLDFKSLWLIFVLM